MALAALADDVAPAARGRFLDVLRHLVAGEGTDAESARRGLDLPELCRNVAAQGLRLLYGEVMTTCRPPTADLAGTVPVPVTVSGPPWTSRAARP
ncbi:hypothetical protein ACFU6K_35555, partial [Kitasatospora sp. NPDC057512]|uniref:hypothetical protein n=1 Tax=Kitasatospora sp. NPDC057512 TaxID=3346154 RepID=UPI0036915F68